MATSILSPQTLPELAPLDVDARNANGISWAAVLAGAAGAAALSLILVILGFGLGLSSISPWANTGASAGTIGTSTILWLTFTQLAASGLGGYLAGRLRARWTHVHADEVYFRDTAHGFLAWAIASLATAAFLSTAVTAALGGSIRAGAAVAQTTVQATATSAISRNSSAGSDAVGYYVDSLFRSEAPVVTQLDPATRVEVAKVLANDIRQGELPNDDKRYIGQLVARQTSLSQADAEKRVADTYTRVTNLISAAETHAREAADKTRKATAYAALWMFVALLAGAFLASLMALFGGRLRDKLQ
ncbi:hypothetical protein VVD49_01745 [Uliginosibacterium sp. H3]|uniref:Transmembrane protein n=1 Tax=Uliginosibacterium silvisoli TaxID=3114758 RepID=A0ABU6JYE6_9RHOO|nr:hypothetical protein [Uliginosibacterium sp. H3]